MTRPAPGQRYFAACTLGLEAVLDGELQALGATEIEVRRGGVAFRGDTRLGYAACLWLRSATRLQLEIVAGEVRSERDLYELVRSVDWSRHMSLQQTLAVDASVRDAALTHSQYAGLKVKDAVVDQFRAASGARPSVDTQAPDLPLKLVLKGDHATLYKELGGESLHKRGYRPVQVKSPLNEAIAAGLLLLTKWDRKSPLADPMCGSGTFLIEAALLATERAPGLLRRFAFERWPDHDRAVWSELRADARRRVKSDVALHLEGADRHPGAIAIAVESAQAAGVGELVRFTRAECRAWRPAVPPRFVVVNPPYGERLGEGDELATSWRDLGAFLREQCPGAWAYVLSGSPELTRHLGLRSSVRWPVRNGPIECRWVEYEIGPRR